MADQVLTQAQLLEQLNPNGNTYQLDRRQFWRDLVVSYGPTSGNAAIVAGTINGATIGASTPSSGAFTTLSASSIVTAGGNASAANFLLDLNGIATAARKIQWQTAGVGRWDWGLSVGGEPGLNAGSDLTLQRRSDAGAIIDASLTIARSSGLATWIHGSTYNLGTVTLSGAITADQQAQLVRADYTGTNLVDSEVDYNRWLINSDTAQLLGTTTGYGGIFSMKLQTGFTGNRIGLGSTMNVLGQSGNKAAGTPGDFDIALWGNITGTANQGGVSLTTVGSYGSIWAGLLNARLAPTATNYALFQGLEIDVNNEGTTIRKHGLQISLGPTDANRGALFDAAIMLGNSTASAGTWKNGFLLSEDSSQWPFASDSTLIGALMGENDNTNPAVADLGLDLLDVTFGTAPFRSNGFSVDGSGNVQIGAGFLKPASSGLTIDAIGAIGNTANGAGMIVSGGTGWVGAGQILTDPYGGRYKTTGVAGGVITGLNVYRQPRFPSTTTPANPVTLTGRSGSGLTAPTINISWNTTATTLALQPSGGLTTLGGLAQLKTFTVATLPAAAAGNLGCVAYVSDATAPTYRGALVGGGAIKTLVFSDGAAWTSH